MPPLTASPSAGSHITLPDLQAAVATALPLPGSGRTAERWGHLVTVGRDDLALAKLVEPHHDATAILADLGGRPPADGEVWAVWAAEPPGAGLRAETGIDADLWRLSGHKPFCSGASIVTHALVTAHDTRAERSRLFAVDLRTARDQDECAIVEPPSWVGVGMSGADTRTLTCVDVQATPVGEPGAYTDRAGFWHGAIGVAACWVGGMRGVAACLLATCIRRPPDDVAAMHLGAVAVAVDRCEAVLAMAATRVDAGEHETPEAARRDAESVRATVADAVDEVILRIGHALGPGPLVLDAEHAQRVADLQVFVRQHHGESDLAALGRLLSDGALRGQERW